MRLRSQGAVASPHDEQCGVEGQEEQGTAPLQAAVRPLRRRGGWGVRRLGGVAGGHGEGALGAGRVRHPLPGGHTLPNSPIVRWDSRSVAATEMTTAAAAVCASGSAARLQGPGRECHRATAAQAKSTAPSPLSRLRFWAATGRLRGFILDQRGPLDRGVCGDWDVPAWNRVNARACGARIQEQKFN